jgi:hypothetical protein
MDGGICLMRRIRAAETAGLAVNAKSAIASDRFMELILDISLGLMSLPVGKCQYGEPSRRRLPVSRSTGVNPDRSAFAELR